MKARVYSFPDLSVAVILQFFSVDSSDSKVISDVYPFSSSPLITLFKVLSFSVATTL